MLRELARSYLTIVKDLTRVMSRLKAVYRSWAIPCAGRDVYYTRHRAEWLGKIKEAGVRRRAERLYQQLDMLQYLRQQARRELLAESRQHAITVKLRQIPVVGCFEFLLWYVNSLAVGAVEHHDLRVRVNLADCVAVTMAALCSLARSWTRGRPKPSNTVAA